MVTIEELKLGNRTLEALKFLLEQITELEVAINQIDMSELKNTNELTKEQITTLANAKEAVERINSELLAKKADFDDKKQNFDSNMSAFRLDKADFDDKKADFDAKNTQALSNFAFISDNVEKINSTSSLLAEAKATLAEIKTIEQRTQAVLEAIANSQAKFAELESLKATLLELKKTLESISIVGLISDNITSETKTYSSKKINDLVNNAKTALTDDINNQKQSIATLDSKVNTAQNNLKSVTNALEQKADKATFDTFITKTTNDLSLKANKNDAYTKAQSDDKFALKSQITTSYFEPYNKVFLDSIKIEGLKDILNVIDPFEDGSGVALYTFEEGGNEINRLNTYSNGNSRFGTRCISATEQRDAGTKLQDSDKQAFAGDFTISMWINPSSVVTNASHNYHRFLSLQVGFTAFLSDNNTRFNINVGTNSSWYGDDAFLQSVASAGIKLDEWNHFILYRKNGLIKIIINRKELPQSITSNTDFSKNIYYLCVAGDIQLSSGLATQPFAGYVDQVRIFNRALTQKEVDALALEKRFDTSSPNSIVCQGHAYISSGKNQNNLYENHVYVINATLEERERPNGTYYIKAKADNTLELVEQKPIIGTKSNNSEYYIDGMWFSQNAEKLPLQAYLSYTVDILDNKFIGLRLSNIDANANTSIGVNQTWQDVKSQRINGAIYTNTTSRPIMILVSQQQSSSSQTCELEINGVRVIKNVSYGTADGCIISAVIPVGATYKVIYKNYPPLEWQELR